MAGSNLDLDQLLYNDAESIEIDEDFKNNLKQRILSEHSSKKTIQIRNTNRYLKIASGFAIAVIISGSIAATLKLNNKGMVAKVDPAVVIPSEDLNNPGLKEKDTEKDLIAGINSGTNKDTQIPAPVPNANSQSNQTSLGSSTPSSALQEKPLTGEKVNQTAPAVNAPVPNTPAPIAQIAKISVLKTEKVASMPGVVPRPASDAPTKPNSTISPDGKYLTSEENNKIYLTSVGSNDKVFIDNGNKPAWNMKENLISYVKDEVKKEKYGKNSKQKDLYIEKHYSSIWVYDILSGNKYCIEISEAVENTQQIKDWEQKVKDSDAEQTLILKSKYTYMNSVWGQDDSKELYFVVYNNEEMQSEALKYTLEIKR